MIAFSMCTLILEAAWLVFVLIEPLKDGAPPLSLFARILSMWKMTRSLFSFIKFSPKNTTSLFNEIKFIEVENNIYAYELFYIEGDANHFNSLYVYYPPELAHKIYFIKKEILNKAFYITQSAPPEMIFQFKYRKILGDMYEDDV